MTAVVEPMSDGETKEKLYSTLLWRIENISYWEPIFWKKIESPSFEFLNAGACGLYLCLKGEKVNDRKFACCLWFNKNIKSLDYEWSLLDGDGSPVVTRMIRNATMKLNQYVYFLHWPTYEDVFKVRKSSYLTNDTLILRCRFRNSNQDFKQAEYLSGYTRIRVAKTSFLWHIKKFSNLQLDQELVQPFVLQFSEGQIILENNNTWQRLTTTLSILDHEERTMKSLTSKSNFKTLYNPGEQVCRLPELVSRENVMHRKSNWLHDDDLTLLCKFHSVKKHMEYRVNKRYKQPENLKIGNQRNNHSIPKVASMETKITDLSCAESTVLDKCSQTPNQFYDCSKIPQHKTKSVETLQEDFLSLYADHTLSDFVLRSGDFSVHVHKIVLIARSPVFKAMFCGEMKEASSDFLDVPDLDVHTLNRMLTFMYTGILDHLEWDSAAKLYYAADKYQVQSLKQECKHLLQSSISIQNVGDIMELAHRHQDEDLGLFVHDFLVSHYEEVVLSEEWGMFLDRNSTLGEKL